MARDLEIQGGADEFEAAVIAVVIDRIEKEEQAARQGRGSRRPGLPAWVRAMSQERPDQPRDRVWPD